MSREFRPGLNSNRVGFGHRDRDNPCGSRNVRLENGYMNLLFLNCSFSFSVINF